MPGKIANTLSDEALTAMLEKLRSLSGAPTYAQIQAVAKEFGVTVSIEGAKTFRKTTFADHLARLRNGREKSAQILAVVKEGGAHPLDAVEEAAAADLLDAYTSGEEVDTAAIVKVALQLRASLESRKDRDRNDADLARKIADSDSARATNERRTKLLEEKLLIVQLDAARAVLDHAKEIRLIVADNKLDQAAKVARVRERLFGQAPADFQPVSDRGVAAQ